MNVLFLTSFKVSPTQGGTERATISVATGLREIYGWHCFSAYIVDAATARAERFDAALERQEALPAQAELLFSYDALLEKVREAMPQIMALYDQNGWEMGLFYLENGHAEIRGMLDLKEEFDV